MNKMQKSGWSVLVAAALSAPALAAHAAAMPLPVERHQGDVGYLSGGVGEHEAGLFERAMRRHDVGIELLEHAGKKEEFTANALVRITNPGGQTVLDARAEGPFMLVDLPDGHYAVAATLNGQTLKKATLYVKRGELARATFEFPPHTD